MAHLNGQSARSGVVGARQAEVGDLQSAVSVQQDIMRLEISVEINYVN